MTLMAVDERIFIGVDSKLSVTIDIADFLGDDLSAEALAGAAAMVLAGAPGPSDGARG